MKWEPIKTAPRDKTEFLGYCPRLGIRQTRIAFYGEGSQGFNRWEKGEGPLESGWRWIEPQNNWASTWHPTHWMPLPEPPTS
jgi:hypothetical protein